ncbi:origin recognition complex subunit 4 [Aspergillus candidus]|uniref:Origin recognition complex subunit 4 n=1 Tax=Aspergillus candidus TaxID=41067 RepID=A0A2I2EYJ7_ASPCN|nr:putative origin recognition complex subunit Orc4 [Aspergillus candidus]PLB33448.1 putative origin recognition complex subunit Orc4 [Aspergillus candidus]
MKDPRAGKRRRVSDVEEIDADGDVTMDDRNGQTASPPPAHTEDTGTDGQQNATATEPPARPGLRSSGRQRKPPQRFEEIVSRAPSVRRTTSRRTGPTPKSAQTTRPVSEKEAVSEEEAISEKEESDEESTPPPRVTRTRSRAKRAPAKPTPANPDTNGDAPNGSPSPDDYQDGLEDIVSMQLQQGLTQPEVEDREKAVPSNEALPDYAEKFLALCQTGLTDELRVITQTILEKLNGKRPVPLKGLESEYSKAHQLVEQTVTVGEGNSMLLLGSRGSGKTAIVETVISSLRREHGNDFHVVRLNGFLQTDDRLALREMWRQLGRETNTEDEASKVSSYADTMATLLGLLSHPEEIYGAQGNGEASTAAKSVVIVLDEFDLFVSHPRQTLLYNLFDIAQARKAPVAVVGVTTKVDVTEMLEKRVKSRFSHRYVFVPLPRTFDTFSEICFAGLNLEDEEVLDLADGAGQSVIHSENGQRALEGWRAYLEGLWGDGAFQTHLQRIYHQTKSTREFFTSALMTISELHYSTYSDDTTGEVSLQIPTPAAFISQTLSCPDPAPLPFDTSTSSTSQSSLPLSLLLAAARLTALYDPGPDTAQPQALAPLALSFPAAYAEYVRLLTSAKTSASVSGAAATPGRVWGRDVAREAWEKLVSWGLVSAVGGGSGTADGRMFRVEISFEEVVDMAGSGGSLGKWWRDG